MLLLSVFLVAVVALVLGATVPGVWADDDDDEIPFDEASIFFELNDTDGDLGIHALVDGEAWKKLEIESPKGQVLLRIIASSSVRRQGLTELFFESAEPPFESDDPDEVTLTPEQFFQRFPEGTYEFEGITLEGDELESEVELTHMMPAPPEFTINGNPARPAGEDAECEEDPLPTVNGDVIIDWDPVTESHPDIGDPQGSTDIVIVLYQVVAECEDEDENVFVFSVDVQPSDEPMSVTVPAAFFGEDMECKIEVQVREESGNQTATESCPFERENDNGEDENGE